MRRYQVIYIRLQGKPGSVDRKFEERMEYYSRQISKLIQELSALPGIGTKSAQRLAFHIPICQRSRWRSFLLRFWTQSRMCGIARNVLR